MKNARKIILKKFFTFFIKSSSLVRHLIIIKITRRIKSVSDIETKPVNVEIPIPVILRMRAVSSLVQKSIREFITEAIAEKCDKEIKENNLSL